MQKQPALADYDFVIINTSAGKDSQTALAYVVAQADKEAFPRSRLLLAHADLGPMEWPGTAELAATQAAHYGLELARVERSQNLLAHIQARGMWPSSTNRFCTSDHKRDQIAKLFTRLASDLAAPGRPCRILNVMGMRAQESPARAKLAPLSRNARVSNGRKLVDNWLPLHSWQLPDVWSSIKASGVPYHKAYDLGMPRLSCVFCIFSPPAALMLAGKQHPDLLAQYVDAEKAMGHTFRHKFSLASVQRSHRPR